MCCPLRWTRTSIPGLGFPIDFKLGMCQIVILKDGESCQGLQQLRRRGLIGEFVSIYEDEGR